MAKTATDQPIGYIKPVSDKFDLNIRLWSIEDYGGWNEAYKTYFDDGAMFDEIYGN